MSKPQLIEKLWKNYQTTLPETHRHRTFPFPGSWSFGYGKRLADELADLVLRGKKTATCSRYLGGNVLDEGGLSIITDGDGIPRCVVETYEITIRAFGDVDAEFAADEGEGDQSLEYWRKAHWEFFAQESVREGLTVSEEMLLLCERFRVIHVNQAAIGGAGPGKVKAE